MTAVSSDVAFTPSVKAAQAAHGTREAYARMEARGGFRTEITPELASSETTVSAHISPQRW
jgi:hypothetical protein